MAAQGRICVGRIAGPYGVRGWVRITSYTENPADVAAYGPVSDADGGRRFEIEVKRMGKAHAIARIGGIDDRDAAEALRGVRLFVPRTALPPTEDDEYYCEDLTGMQAETTDGRDMGRVLSVQDYGAGDMLEVGAERGATVLVPFTRDVVPVVDLAGRRIVIDPPEGLLDEEGGAP